MRDLHRRKQNDLSDAVTPSDSIDLKDRNHFRKYKMGVSKGNSGSHEARLLQQTAK